MRLHDFCIILCVTLLMTPIFFLMNSESFAQVRESSSYKIESDSINFGGGLSSSTNYAVESTLGEVGTGNASSTSYNLRAGYQQMTTRFISLSTPASVIMTPSIGGVTGGESNGSTTVTVTTDSSAGYTLTIASEETPALRKGIDMILDYVPAGGPDFAFTTDTGEAHFGYSPEGVDTVARFLDNGVACGAGSLDTALACWDGLDIASEAIAQSSESNHPDGATTTVYFKVGVAPLANPVPGTYIATTTLTALPL